jgi:hypothetical protein
MEKQLKDRRPLWVGTAPVALAIGVTLLNDFFLKTSPYAGFVTGKLSDVFGLFFFPFFVYDVFRLLDRRRSHRTPACELLTFAGICMAAGVAFAALKCTDSFAAYYIDLYAALFDMRVGVTMDHTDLFALPALVAAYGYFRARTARTSEVKPFARKLIAASVVGAGLSAPVAFGDEGKTNEDAHGPSMAVSLYAGFPLASSNQVYRRLQYEQFNNERPDGGYSIWPKFIYPIGSIGRFPTAITGGLMYAEISNRRSYGDSEMSIKHRVGVAEAGYRIYWPEIWKLHPFTEAGLNIQLLNTVTFETGTGKHVYYHDAGFHRLVPFRLDAGASLPVCDRVSVDFLASVAGALSPTAIYLGGTYALQP